MKWIRSVIVVLVICFISGSCLEQPNYSIVPRIDLQSINYKKGGANLDTLVFILKFRDGDGNLGVNPDETAVYYSATDSVDIRTPYYFIYDTVQNQILYYDHTKYRDLTTVGPNLSYVDYKAKRTRSVFDTLPELSCDHYAYPSTDPITNIQQADTVYSLDNINNHNIFINAYYIKGSDTIRFTPNSYFQNGFTSQCQSSGGFLNGRFPILSTDPGNKSPLDGTIIYKYSSLTLGAFRGLTMFFDIYITDRTYVASTGRFQTSNVIRTDIYKF